MLHQCLKELAKLLFVIMEDFLGIVNNDETLLVLEVVDDRQELCLVYNLSEVMRQFREFQLLNISILHMLQTFLRI